MNNARPGDELPGATAKQLNNLEAWADRTGIKVMVKLQDEPLGDELWTKAAREFGIVSVTLIKRWDDGS